MLIEEFINELGALASDGPIKSGLVFEMARLRRFTDYLVRAHLKKAGWTSKKIGHLKGESYWVWTPPAGGSAFHFRAFNPKVESCQQWRQLAYTALESHYNSLPKPPTQTTTATPLNQPSAFSQSYSDAFRLPIKKRRLPVSIRNGACFRCPCDGPLVPIYPYEAGGGSIQEICENHYLEQTTLDEEMKKLER